EVILAGRKINDYMGKYIAEQTVKELIKSRTPVRGCRILIMGVTFKEDVKDVRNTRVIDIYNELKEYGVQPFIFDPEADKDVVKSEYSIDLIEALKDFCPYEGIIAAVRHKEFGEFSMEYLRSICNTNPVLIDVKGSFDAHTAKAAGFSRYWRL